jgi:adenylyltransferase/sulfurtransferase
MLKNEIPQITVKELKQRIDAGQDVFLLDVREPYEYQIAQIPKTMFPSASPKSPVIAIS